MSDCSGLLGDSARRLDGETGLSHPSVGDDRHDPRTGFESERHEVVELVPATHELRSEGRELADERSLGAQRRERGVQPIDCELMDVLRGREAPERVCSKIQKRGAVWERTADEAAGRPREEDLPAVARGFDPRHPVHFRGEVVVSGRGDLCGVECHAHHEWSDDIRPFDVGETSLGCHRRVGRFGGGVEGDEEPVPGVLDDGTTVLDGGRSDDFVVRT